MRFEPFDWYEQPLYYDIIFDDGTEQEAAFLQAVHERHGTSRGRSLLEPACGSGRLLEAMAQRGFDVTGFDLSQAMLDFTASRLRESPITAKLFRASMESFRTRRRFNLAHCLVSTFKYLRMEDAVRGHFTAMSRALKPGGVYVLGLHLCDYEDERRQRERWVVERDGVHVVCNIQSWPADRSTRSERVRSRLTVTERGKTHRLESNWIFRSYSFRQLKLLLRTLTEFEHIATYDFNHDIDRPIPFDGDQLDVVLVLRRKNH